MGKFDFVKEVEEKQAALLSKLCNEVKSFPELKPNEKPYYFYNVAYRSLRAFTRDYIEYKDKERRKIDVLALAHMVYGWMPTILNIDKKNAEQGVPSSKNWLNYFNIAIEKFNSNFEEIRKVNKKIDKQKLEDVIENTKIITNNSVIGASKLLHFINPEIFPIYDSRVFHAIRKLSGSKKEKEDWNTVDNISKYISYIAMIMGWCNKKEILNKIKNELNEKKYIDDETTDIRTLEVALFVYGGENEDNLGDS